VRSILAIFRQILISVCPVLSFPHVLGGNLLFIKPNVPTCRDEHDKFGILLPTEIIMFPKLVFPDRY